MKLVKRIDVESGEIKIFKSAKLATDSVNASKGTAAHLAKNGGKFKNFRFEYYTAALENEEWRTHPLLTVDCSNQGRIKYHKTDTITVGYFAGGYRNCKIGVKGYKVHRLILETFKPVDGYQHMNPQHIQTNHIDFNRSNNKVDNLEWVTPKENCYHRDHNK
jgi:hypothetical protein